MKRIVKPNEEDTVSIKSVKDNARVGIILMNEKYLIVSKRDAMDNICYSRMNDNSFVLAEEYKSIQDLLNLLHTADAFLFGSQQESFEWLMD